VLAGIEIHRQRRKKMAAVCPTGFNVDYLRATVRATYDRVARAPRGEFHFHRGADYARDFLQYDPADIAFLPEAATARFAGVGNPLLIGPVRTGERVLDHACGAGTDLLLAARRIGPTGRAIGIDMTEAMRDCARAAAELAGVADRVEIAPGYMESLPLRDESVDLVISNGVVNLAPDKPQVFREIARVLKPGGRLYLADVVVARELTLDARENPDLWAACIAGAMVEDELPETAAACGLGHGRIAGQFNCFQGTSAEAKVARDLNVHGVNFYARKAA
jgi:arsenite methyltransferase